MNLTTTVGLPGRASDKSGAKKFAHLAEPPVSENGMVHSMVLPDISTSACAGAAIAAAAATAITERRVNLYSDISFLPMGAACSKFSL